MLPLERQKQIIELLNINTVMKMGELAEHLNVSVDTLRRDINILVKNGEIEKIYGGVKLAESSFGESSLGIRMDSNTYEKESIAKTCSELIQDGDCIYLDSGSTTYRIAKHIHNKKNLTVVTNSFPLISELMNTEVELIIIGGLVRKSEQSVVTFDYLFNFEELNIVKAFICASGVSIDRGISDYNMEEAITRKKIIELSAQTIVAADSSKFGKNVTVSIASLNQIDSIVTDRSIHRDIVEKMHIKKTKLIIAK